MKLSKKTLTKLAEMICGAAGGAGFEWQNFKYRSSYYLTEFFKDCDMDFVHDGSTRKDWVFDVLIRLNSGPTSNPQLPADGILRVLRELFDPADFQKNELNRDGALEDLNNVLARDNLQAYLDARVPHDSS